MTEQIQYSTEQYTGSGKLLEYSSIPSNFGGWTKYQVIFSETVVKNSVFSRHMTDKKFWPKMYIESLGGELQLRMCWLAIRTILCASTLSWLRSINSGCTSPSSLQRKPILYVTSKYSKTNGDPDCNLGFSGKKSKKLKIPMFFFVVVVPNTDLRILP